MNAQYLKWLLFSFEGRIGRMIYFLSYILTCLVSGVLTFLIASLGNDALYILFFFVSLIVGPWIGGALMIKRLHDLGKSGWFSLLILIPFINILFIVYILFFSGNSEKNEYGEQDAVIEKKDTVDA